MLVETGPSGSAETVHTDVRAEFHSQKHLLLLLVNPPLMSENTSVNPGVFIDGSWQDCDAARLVSQSPIDGSEVAAFSVAGEDAAGRTIDAGIAGLAGQACTATSRAIVFESVHDEYLDRLVTAIEDLTVGDPLDEETDVGPKYSESGLETDLEYIEAGREEGATLVTGGKRLTGGSYDDGYFVEPTVFTDVDPEIRIAQEEIFGPVLSVIEVGDYDEAIAVANGVDYGLSAALCTNRLDRTQEFADRIETGVVKINQTSTGVEMQLPFGGRKNSSSETFKEQGRQALEFYTHEKAVYVTHTAESD